ncbi:3-hydroxyisobutyrate dehydrogenase-like beta-hydroxyacid dehydrogenase [Kibdelosporangium banguiense]|uniref:3-hydroxyisobutyrate dehydrogenase-like beta-hydroxyacid dehydrogenase n=1 Tax=Kibdelosporangium banguiense TaxID=1365924 RepID=A0ABS4T9G8_9PSEU|nr:NAD(P)-binding domain-containing protein [Kibdelosporangium banguiense]MBP2321043.1 3-hydroxyisobutyrate dehydrogenase-like beta-hydroxyacid dehydrogenase [Kibdelosporangium banguiense]
MNVTVLGLGKMGSAIAVALSKAGYETTVWNRTPGKVVEGAVHASTAREAIAASPVVLAVVADYATVRELYQGSTGGALINLATGTPEEAAEMAAWAAEHGIDYVDGAMLAVPQQVATPDAQFIYSGSTKVFEDNQKLLDVLATSRYLGTDPVVAALWDTALLGVGYSTLLGFFHAAALLDTAGTGPKELLPLAGQWIQGMVGWLADLSAEIESGEYGNAVSSVDLNRTAAANLVNTSLARGVSTETLAPFRSLLDRRSADGHGADSLSSLFELLKQR